MVETLGVCRRQFARMGMEEEARAALARMPVFRGVDLDDIDVERLGGLTNRTYSVESPAGSFVLRLAGEGTGGYIDRKAEAHNARIAARAGVNAEVVSFDTDSGVMLCRMVADSTPVDARTFHDHAAVARAAAALKRLHGCGAAFAGHFDPFSAIDSYEARVGERGAPLPEGYREAAETLAPARAVLAAQSPNLVPCHGDPVPENFLDTGARMYLIDYEYSGSGDPMWDLAYLSVEGDFRPAADAALIAAYFGDAPQARDAARVAVYKAVCSLLSALWGVLRRAGGNADRVPPDYVAERLTRCRAQATSAEFTHGLSVLRRNTVPRTRSELQ